VTVVKARAIAAVLLPLALAATACGPGPGDQASAREGSDVTVAMAPPISGWMEVTLPGGAPVALLPDESGAWACYDGGVLLRCDLADGKWHSYSLGGGASTLVDAASSGQTVLLLSDSSLIEYTSGEEATITPLPEGFTPVALGVSGEGRAVLGSDGGIAIAAAEGFEIARPAQPALPASGLYRNGPDWVYASSGALIRYDAAAGLWQSEPLPGSGVLAAMDGSIFLGTRGRVLRRTGPEAWERVCNGRLYDSGLVLTAVGVSSALDPQHKLAGVPAVVPGSLAAASAGPVWAGDEQGLLAYAPIGALETRLPGYDLEMIECTLAGQGGTTSGGSAGVTPVLSAASGAFRIYESVSSRPDPFTEFPAHRRDLRRPLDQIAIEELKLVGITIDPTGGDQAMVEDANSVPYILYVGSELANNTRVAEITGNEVIVVQEVTVDYGPDRGGEASIPTIYSMRLHEEGGL